jgi:membrane-bound ClpP family serine protease
MDPLVWSILLMALGLLLVGVEMFLPIAGVLGVISVAAILVSISLAFYYRGLEVGFLFVVVAALGVPAVLAAAFRLWPRTPLGKHLLLQVPDPETVLPDSPQRRKQRELVGKTGVAKTLMLPSGAVMIGDDLVDAISEGLPIEAGQPVKVIEVRGGRVVVRRADPNEIQTPSKADDVLSQSIESLGLDPFEDPLV